MKNFVFIVTILLFSTLYSCQKDDNNIVSSNPTKQSISNNHFYGVITPENQNTQTRGIAQLAKLWENGSTIYVHFKNDPYNAKKQIEEYVKEWQEYANVTLIFRSQPTSSIYNDAVIAFDWEDNKFVTWSYTGTDCLLRKIKSTPTINFAGWNSLSEEERKGDVLRAFGQVLGLELEHRHLNFDPGWASESRIQSLWEGDITDIPWKQLREYVFTPLEKSKVEETAEYDPNSIMIWPFPRNYAANTARDYNNELSDQDKTFISKLYPRNDELLATFTISSYKKESSAMFCEMSIDGDKKYAYKFEFNGYWQKYGSNVLFENMVENESYTTELYGDPTIENINLALNPEPESAIIQDVELSMLQNLTFLTIENIAGTSGTNNFTLDLTNNTKLEYLEIANQINPENIENYPSGYINCNAHFYLEGLTNLKSINLFNIMSTKFYNLESCTSLENITIDNSGISSLYTKSTDLTKSDALLNLVKSLPNKSGKINIKTNKYIDLTEIKKICNSKGWSLEI